MTTLKTVATVHTTRLLAKYRANGTVLQMSMNGWMVRWVGSQWKSPCTSPRGLSDDVTMTYSGTTVNAPRTTMTTRRNTRNDLASCTTGPPVGEEEVGAGHDQQEQQEQHRHGRAEAEVPVDERVAVDVDRDQVGRLRRGRPEQDERRVEVVEHPQEQHQQQHDVHWLEGGECDVADLLPGAGPVDGRGVVHLVGDVLHAGHQHEERERPGTPDGHHRHRHERVVAHEPERRVVQDVQVLLQHVVQQPVVPLQDEAPRDDP